MKTTLRCKSFAHDIGEQRHMNHRSEVLLNKSKSRAGRSQRRERCQVPCRTNVACSQVSHVNNRRPSPASQGARVLSQPCRDFVVYKRAACGRPHAMLESSCKNEQDEAIPKYIQLQKIYVLVVCTTKNFARDTSADT